MQYSKCENLKDERSFSVSIAEYSIAYYHTPNAHTDREALGIIPIIGSDPQKTTINFFIYNY